MDRLVLCGLKVSFSSSAILRSTVGAGLLMASLSAWPIARHPDANVADVPAGLINATVRVKGSIFGSGIVVAKHRDTSGPGGWLCVLTADHVVRHAREWSIGFGDIDPRNPWPYDAPNMVRGPFIRDSWGRIQSRADLAMLGVRVPDLTRLPELTLPVLSGETEVRVIHMGFGDHAWIGEPRRYDIVESYGTFRSGKNTIDDRVFFQPGINDPKEVPYGFDAFVGDLDFLPGGEWPPKVGESHPLKGDSGGPTVHFDSGARVWRLVGVHSWSEWDPNPKYTFVSEGRRWWDVRVGSYLSWVDDACQQVIPEPASMTALSAGLLILTISRLRRK